MHRVWALALVGILLFAGKGFAYTLHEWENYKLGFDAFLRTDVVTFNNVVDLDSNNSMDSCTYFGIDYSLAFDLRRKDDGPEFYLKLERNGPWDYDAPLFIKNRLMVTKNSRVYQYTNDELLPEIEEMWSDFKLFNSPMRFRSGFLT